MSKRIDLSGLKFSSLLVLKDVGNNKHGRAIWECICDCGNHTIVEGAALRIGKSKSCSCKSKSRLGSVSITHGHTIGKKYSSEYNCWIHMKGRCYNTKNKSYPDYGGRGIKVCDRWVNDFNLFLLDMGNKPSKEYSIDRIDNNGDYSPSNCRWATRLQQNRNKRNTVLVEYMGQLKTMPEWCEILGFKRKKAMYVLKKVS